MRVEDVRQLTFTDTITVGQSNPDEYVYTLPAILALLSGYFEGAGDTEQRADVVRGLKRLERGYAEAIVLFMLGVAAQQAATRLGITRWSYYRRRNRAIRMLMVCMNGGAK